MPHCSQAATKLFYNSASIVLADKKVQNYGALRHPQHDWPKAAILKLSQQHPYLAIPASGHQSLFIG